MRSTILFLCLLAFAVAKRQIVRDVKNTAEMNRIMAHHKLTGLPVVVDYYSDTCGPCRQIAPVYKNMAKEYENRAVFLKVNTQYAHDLSAGVRSLPTFRFFMNGKKVNEFAGAGEGQLRQIIGQLSGQARRRKSHIFEAKDKSALNNFLANSATLPVVVSFVSKTNDGCKEVWPHVKKMAQQAFGRAIFLKVDVDASTPLAEAHEISETPTFHFYQVKKLHSEIVTGPDHAKVKQILAEMMKKSPEDAKNAAQCPDIKPVPKHPKVQRPQTRSPFRAKMNRPEKVVILGAGPAGLSAAVYAARAGLRPVVVAPDFGGQLMFTKDVENYPAVFAETGPKLLDAMRAQAEQFDTNFEAVTALKVDLSVRPFQITINRTEEEGNLMYAHTLIISTGADARWLGAEGEATYRAKGISTCATCDGFLYRNQDVIVVGGGDTAMEESLYLARICSKVTIIHRGTTFRASHYLRERVLANPKITVQWESVVKRFEGNGTAGLNKVVIAKKNSEEEETIAVGAAFVAIGHDPNTGLFKDQVTMDKEGYLTLPGKSTATSVPGVFACGDVADNVYRQAVTSAGTGAMAALDVERYLNENEVVDPPAMKVDYSKWKIKELKDAMKEMGISMRGCVEKKDFIERLSNAQQ